MAKQEGWGHELCIRIRPRREQRCDSLCLSLERGLVEGGAPVLCLFCVDICPRGGEVCHEVCAERVSCESFEPVRAVQDMCQREKSEKYMSKTFPFSLFNPHVWSKVAAPHNIVALAGERS